MKGKAQSSGLACIVLAAGKGTRMRSDLAKVMHPIAHKPMLFHVLDAVAELGAEKIVVVTSPDMETVRSKIAGRYKGRAESVVQTKPRGTGDAARAAKGALGSFPGTVLILCGDTPLVRPETLAPLLRKLQEDPKLALAVLGMEVSSPNAYGHLVVSKKHGLERIVEARDAAPKEQAITLCHSGVMAVRGKILFSLLARLTDKNAKKEFYLTDLVSIARKQGLKCDVATADATELMGVNSRTELARAEAAMQDRLRERAMENGATLLDPSSVYLSHDTSLGEDVIVHPHVIFGPGVEIADGVEIRSFSHLEGAKVKSGAGIGPFARLRPGSVVGENARVGNFVEIKNSVLGAGAKANHLSYIGDAQLGAGANIGAGTITVNYDGYGKHRTVIGDRASIGSNTSLIAPIVVGEGAIVAAGSVITEDVEADALAISRARQEQKPSWAKAFRKRKQH